MQFSVTGAVANPTVFAQAQLDALPAITQTVSYTAAGVPQTRTYVGASLWGVLDSTGIVTNTAVSNDVLNRYVTATGADGYKVVFSLGEINPLFGNRPDLVAHKEVVNGVTAPIGADGFARITAPGDIRGGRYVSNLTNLDVRASGSTATGTGGGVSTQFSVTGNVLAAKTFDLAGLQALPAITRAVNGVSYTGVSFWDLLNASVGIAVNAGISNDLLGKYVVATGSDGYKSVFSIGELSANFGNQPDLIAYAADGVSLTTTGFARLVVPNDDRRGRWVSNLVSLEVLSATPVPEPGTLVTMLSGMAAMAVMTKASRRRH